MRKPRMCMVLHGSYPSGESRVTREARAAIAQGFEVDIIALKRAGEPKRETVEDARVLRLPIQHARGVGAIRLLLEYLGFTALAGLVLAYRSVWRSYDVIHVHNPPDFLIAATWIPKLMGVRVIFDAHDLSPDMFLMRFATKRGAALALRVLKLIERIACAQANVVITVHEPYRRELIARGVPPSKTVVVMNSVDETLLSAAADQPAGDEDMFRIVYHGTLTPHYGLPTVVEAFASVSEAIPNARLEIYGEGDDVPHIRSQIDDLGLTDRVKLVPEYLAQAEVLRRVAGASVGVVPNLDIPLNRFALSTKLFEYVALGIPVIASDLATLREHFTDDELRFVSAGNPDALAAALIEAADDPAALARRADAAKARYEDYRWEISASRYRSILLSLVPAERFATRLRTLFAAASPADGNGRVRALEDRAVVERLEEALGIAPINVLVVTNMYPTAGAPAVGTFVHDQVESLRAAGINVDVLHIDSATSRWNYLRAPFKLWRALHRREYDLIHAHYVFSGVIARSQRKVPVVLTHHGCEVLGYPRWQTWLAKLVTPLFDEVVYMTEEMRRAMRDDDGWVIPCGIDLDAFRPIPRDEARAALGLPADQPLVLWAGDPSRPEKQFWLAEKAVARLKETVADAELVLLTMQPHEVVPAYMSACDALVLTSRLEGSPMVVKEAMACNLPVVSVRVGDVPEVVDGAEPSAIAEGNPADIARRLAEALQPARRTDGRSRMRRFSHDGTAAAITHVYRRAIWRTHTPRRARNARDKQPAVCIVHHYYYPQHGHLRRDAETLVRAGYDVTVVALQQPGQPAEERINGVDVVRLPIAHQRGSVGHYIVEYGRMIAMTFWTLTRLHLRKRFRVIEIDNMPDVLVFSALVPKLTGAKVILYIFDNMPELLMVTRSVPARHPLVRFLLFLERVSAAFADHVIVTQETARELAHDRGIPARKLSVVLNGPDEAIFTPPVPAALDRRRNQDGTLDIVTHGTILERFGIQILIAALPLIHQAVPGARLTVYGEGEYRSELETHARRAGVADHVRFGGWVPLDHLPETLRRFDVGYVGMLCNNMLSNKLMEYVALGLPVVAARWQTYEHYFNEQDLVYFDAGSPESLALAIVGVYRDPAAAQRRAEHALERFREYGWSVQQHAYRGVHDRLAGMHRDDGRLDSTVREQHRADTPDEAIEPVRETAATAGFGERTAV